MASSACTGEAQDRRGATPFARQHLQAARHQLCQVTAQRQPQAGAGRDAGLSTKRLEELHHAFGCNALATVRHRQQHLACARWPLQRSLHVHRALPAVLDGIGQQVAHHLLQAQRVQHQKRFIGRQRGAQHDAADGGSRCQFMHHGQHRRFQAFGLKVQLQAPGVQPFTVDQVVQQVQRVAG